LTGPLYRLGGLCARHNRIVIALWVVVFVALAGVARSAGSDLSDNLSLPGTNSNSATQVLQDRFPSQANGTTPVVLRAPSGSKLSDQKYSQAIQQTTKNLQADPDVRSATSPLTSSGKAFLAKSGSDGYIAVNLKPGPSDLSLDDANRLSDELDPARAAGLQASWAGYVGQKLSKPETHSSEVVGLAMAIIVLLFTFGTVVAMGLPIITALFGLVCGISLVTLVSHIAVVPTVAPTLATMIGLGVGIDYALFIVTRHRDQIRDGMEVRESVARAVATSGAAVVFAGSTVIVALLSLAVVGIPLVTTLGYTSAIAVVTAVIGATTLLPAILGMLGLHINSLRLPHKRNDPHDPEPHGWRRWGEFVARHPLPCMLVAVVVLVALAIPVLDLHLGQQDNGALPKSEQARQSYDGLKKGFGVGANGPLLVSVDLSKKPAKADQKQLNKIKTSEQNNKNKAKKSADQQASQIAAQLEAQGTPPDEAQQQANAQVQPGLKKQDDKITKQADAQRKKADQPATDPRLQDLRKDIQKVDHVGKVSQPLVNKSGTAAVIQVTPTTSPSSRSTEDLVRHLRDTTIPAADKGNSMSAYVGGTTAGYIDLADEISSHLIETILVVIALSFILLMLAFRSLVIPLTAGIMNLISIGAAFGVVTLVFEKGFLIHVVGLSGKVPIVSYVPLFMFAVLFGLSMDYEVFLMSHVREAWKRTGSNRASVVEGIATTGRVITSAALIMVAVFFAFIINGDPTVKQFGVGMGVAVAVDATLVRCLLVPAVMLLLGKANWWFPKWLEWLPNFSIEGEEWFRQRDEAAAREALAGQVPADGSRKAEEEGEEEPGRAPA
jgi:RND superfamily putative drug exporter